MKKILIFLKFFYFCPISPAFFAQKCGFGGQKKRVFAERLPIRFIVFANATPEKIEKQYQKKQFCIIMAIEIHKPRHYNDKW